MSGRYQSSHTTLIPGYEFGFSEGALGESQIIDARENRYFPPPDVQLEIIRGQDGVAVEEAKLLHAETIVVWVRD